MIGGTACGHRHSQPGVNDVSMTGTSSNQTQPARIRRSYITKVGRTRFEVLEARGNPQCRNPLLLSHSKAMNVSGVWSLVGDRGTLGVPSEFIVCDSGAVD